MNKDEVIIQVANDILSKMNINQIVNAARDSAVAQANIYYEGLSDEEKSQLVNQILAAKTQAEAKTETKQENKSQEAELVNS